MRLENRFSVPASPERTWALLSDAPRIIPCMPGAELTGVVDDDNWKVTLHVKLGPIALQFATDVRREQADAAERAVRLSAKGRELRGRGNAQVALEARLSGTDSGTDVVVLTDLNLQGAVAQYGRGIVADVAAQLTGRFAECVAGMLRQDDAATPTEQLAGAEVRPVAGLRLALGALWRSVLAFFRRRPPARGNE